MFDTLYNDFQLNAWYDWSNNWMFIVSMGWLAFEALRLLYRKAVTWNIVGDTVANFVTFSAFSVITYVFIAAVYIGGFYYVYANFSITQLPTNGWTILACILLADLAYYWEHRMTHRVGIGWATHTVHHSSPYFNISVAYRFGPLDGIMPFFFHLPLAVLGFNPVLIFLSESLVLAYQTLLHTEVIRKLPRPIEAIFNTPSHHRVHHGSNKQYHDRNYAGILIVWDRMFGTFAEEKEKVVYGISDPIDSVNPITVFVHGLQRLGGKMLRARGWRNKLAYLWRPPEWEPG